MNLVGEYDITKLCNFEVILIACYSLALSLSISLSALYLSIFPSSYIHSPPPLCFFFPHPLC